jgi:formylglycine-generating enzyme required for sulfatase activity
MGDVAMPVTHVDWCDARAFCVAQGKRLCGAVGGGPTAVTEINMAAKDEWFNACTRGGTQAYPYGTTYNPTACNGLDSKVGATVAVSAPATCAGGFPGLIGMSGNVWEWEDACNAATGAADPCQRRGGSYLSNSTLLDCTVKAQDTRDTATSSIGIRCCAD